MSALQLALAALLLGSGVSVWILHSRAWGLGTRSPVLSYDAAQYALAARELAEHGRLATSFALPIELARHPSPPWPLALVQPGLVVLEAALFRIASPWTGTDRSDRNIVAERREYLVLSITLICFLAIGVILPLVAMRMLERHAPGLSPSVRLLAGGVVGLGFPL